MAQDDALITSAALLDALLEKGDMLDLQLGLLFCIRPSNLFL